MKYSGQFSKSAKIHGAAQQFDFFISIPYSCTLMKILQGKMWGSSLIDQRYQVAPSPSKQVPSKNISMQAH
jgi:hypothetical protein